MIVAFFCKEFLNRFVAWVENTIVEAAEFKFFDVISALSGDLYIMVTCLYRHYSNLSKILHNVVISAWFGENESCDPAHIFDVIHENFMKWHELKIFLDR